MLLGMTACSAGGGADESWSKVESTGKLVMGFDEAFPPMGFKDSDGTHKGFDIDVAKEVASRLGIELVLQPINWTQKESELKAGSVDMLWNGYTITEDRKEQVNFTDAYLNNRQVVVVMADSAYQTVEDLAGKKLGIQAGSSAAEALAGDPDFKDSVDVVEFDENMMALLDLSNGGVDCVLMDEVVANYYITKGDGYRVLDKELAREEYGIGFRKEDQTLRDKVNDTLIEMAKDGKMAEISTTWFGSDVTTIGK